MAAFVAAIHALFVDPKPWVTGRSPVMTVGWCSGEL